MSNEVSEGVAVTSHEPVPDPSEAGSAQVIGASIVGPAAKGRTRRKTVPTPGLLSTEMPPAWLRMIPRLDADVRGGGWSRSGASLPRQLAGSTVGIVGYGGIGRQVGARLAGFGCEILVHDPVLAAGGAVTSVPLAELLARSDIVTVHCPLSPETRGLIGARTIAAMKPGALLVNTSRGPVVDEPALVDALRSGHLGGAALDVFEHEPPVGSPLLSMPNVVVSPHNAGLSTTSAYDMSLACARAVVAAVAGRSAESSHTRVVNRNALATHPDPAVRSIHA